MDDGAATVAACGADPDPIASVAGVAGYLVDDVLGESSACS
jgi:hypothetical protein